MEARGPSGATRHLGLDFGATNVKWTIVARADDWTVVARDQVATRIPGDAAAVPAAVVDQLSEVATRAIAEAGPALTVGIGVPGLYDPVAGTTRFLVNVPGPWDGYPVAGPVSAATGLPVALINDARAFGVAELRLGAARGAHSMVGLTLGTGVGGVIAIDGRVHQGHDGTGGELGHQTIDPDGPWCGCGNRGCLEAYARADQIAAACGSATAEDAVSRAKAGDAQALAGLAQVGRYLGIGIANLITIITPDMVVIGGGVATSLDLLLPSIRSELEARVRTTALSEVEFARAELGTWAGAIGAAVHGAEAAAPAETADPSSVPPMTGAAVR
jgi:glucokinase